MGQQSLATGLQREARWCLSVASRIFKWLESELGFSIVLFFSTDSILSAARRISGPSGMVTSISLQ